MCVDDDTGEGLIPPWADSRVGEFDSEELSNPISVKGRLRANLPYWKAVLHASPAVLHVIESVYVLPLMSEPTPFQGKNQVSALQNAEFVDQCVDKLLTNSCIKELVQPRVYVVHYQWSRVIQEKCFWLSTCVI